MEKSYVEKNGNRIQNLKVIIGKKELNRYSLTDGFWMVVLDVSSWEYHKGWICMFYVVSMMI